MSNPLKKKFEPFTIGRANRIESRGKQTPARTRVSIQEDTKTAFLQDAGVKNMQQYLDVSGARILKPTEYSPRKLAKLRKEAQAKNQLDPLDIAVGVWKGHFE